jgi:hypothetical protein
MRETFIEPSGETVSVCHIEDIIELSVSNTVDTRCDKRIKLDITFSLFRLCEPILLLAMAVGEDRTGTFPSAV